MVGMTEYGDERYNEAVGRVGVYELERDGSARRVSSLDLTDRLPNEASFGQALAQDRDTAVVGSDQAIRIFRSKHGTWHRVLTLDTVRRDFSLSPTTFAYDAGLLAVRADNTHADESRIFVYQIGWNGAVRRIASLEAQGEDTSCFGSSVALERRTIVVGASCGSGAVYVFEQQGPKWKLRTRLVAPDPQAGSEFGSAVDIHRDAIVVGAPEADRVQTDEGFGSGAGYVFRRSGQGWGDVQKVQLPEGLSGGFGVTVAAGKDRLAFGAPRGTTGQFRDEAEVDVYRRDGSRFAFEHQLTGVLTFGHTIDFSGQRLAVGVSFGLSPLGIEGASVYDFQVEDDGT
jgi:hypothetical protein